MRMRIASPPRGCRRGSAHDRRPLALHSARARARGAIRPDPAPHSGRGGHGHGKGAPCRIHPPAQRPSRSVGRRQLLRPAGRHGRESAGWSSGRRLEAGVQEELLSYGWPGNVRELRMALERAGELVGNGTLSRSAVAEAIELGQLFQGTLRNGSRLRGRYAVSRGDVLAALSRNGWDAERAAAELGFGRTTFFKRLKELGLSLRAERKFTSTP